MTMTMRRHTPAKRQSMEAVDAAAHPTQPPPHRRHPDGGGRDAVVSPTTSPSRRHCSPRHRYPQPCVQVAAGGRESHTAKALLGILSRRQPGRVRSPSFLPSFLLRSHSPKDVQIPPLPRGRGEEQRRSTCRDRQTCSSIPPNQGEDQQERKAK